MRIAISGKMYSGKTELAYNLCYYGFKRYSFATAVKEACAKKLGMSYTGFDVVKHKHRELMQEIGAKERQFDPNYWVNILLNKIGTEDLDPNIVVDDLRYPNEAAALRADGFYLVRLNCSEDVRKARAELKGVYLPGFEHESEYALDGWPDWDYVVPKNAPVAQPDRLARHILGTLLMKEFSTLP